MKPISDEKLAEWSKKALEGVVDLSDAELYDLVRELAISRIQLKAAQRGVEKAREDAEIKVEAAHRLTRVAENNLRSLEAELARVREQLENAEEQVKTFAAGPPAQMSFNGALVPITSEGMRFVISRYEELNRLHRELAKKNEPFDPMKHSINQSSAQEWAYKCGLLQGSIYRLTTAEAEKIFKKAWHDADARKLGPGTKVKAGLTALREWLLEEVKQCES